MVERLSPVDAAFLDAETPTQPLNVLAVLVLDPTGVPGGATFRLFHERVRDRVPGMTPLRRHVRRLATGQVAWVEDDEVHIDRHLRHGLLDPPGGLPELGRLTADLAAGRLPRDRPLWEASFVEGMAGDRVAVVAKIHHCVADGVSGIGTLADFFDLTPDPPPPAPRRPPPDTAPDPFELAQLAVDGVRSWPGAFGRSASQLARTWMATRAAGADAPRPPAPFTAPRLSMNHALTERRSVAFARLPLDEIKQVRRHFGVTVNDVVLALCTEALRNHLLRHRDLPGGPVVALVPTSERGSGDPLSGNKVSAMFCTLPVQLPDPVERLVAVQRSAALAKEHYLRRGAGVLDQVADLFPPGTIGSAMSLIRRLKLADTLPPFANVVVSNVRGPDFPLYVSGAPLEQLYPLGPLAEGIGLNVTVASYLDHVHFGFLACPDLLPDVAGLAADVAGALADLLRTAGTTERDGAPPAQLAAVAR